MTNMNLKRVLVLIMSVVVTSDSVTVPPVICQTGMYYDAALGRCDFCGVICDFAEIQGTINECQRYCPDFKSTKFESKTENHQETTASAVTTSTPQRSCDTEKKTIAILLIALSGVSALLIGLMVFLVAMAFRRVHTNKTSTKRYVQSAPTIPLITGSEIRTNNNSKRLFLESIKENSSL